MAVSTQKPWKAEYAKSARSSCKICRSAINKEVLRLGKVVQATHFDGFITKWHHAGCILKKANQIKSLDDIESWETLRWEDQQKIRNCMEDSESLNSNNAAAEKLEYRIEVSQTARAICRICKRKIMKEEVRLSSKPEGFGNKGIAWHHAKCFLETFPFTELENLYGWRSLLDTDQAALLPLVKMFPSAARRPRTGRKRRSNADDTPKPKLAKTNREKSPSDAAARSSDSGTDMETQTKQLWNLKDDLRKYVTNTELREMLKVNEQRSAGSELDLSDRCADGMMFGALSKCTICSGPVSFSGGTYRCHGYISEWSKCSYSTGEHDRVKGKWKIPEETNNQFLLKWFKSQELMKHKRILCPSSSNEQSAKGISQSSSNDKLEDLKVSFSGFSKESLEEWKKRIEEVGGEFHAKVQKGTDVLVVSGMVHMQHAETWKARRRRIPVVTEKYLVDCFKSQRKLPFNSNKTQNSADSFGMITVKVKGQSAVNEASGLQDYGHILEDGNSIFNTTLNMSDLSTSVNSYYILQIIQEDRGSGCYVYRKWGRVGDERIGGDKIDGMSKSSAIHEFKLLFREKTGNSWESWEQKKNFQKLPGKFYPLDIDYGVHKQPPKRQPADMNSKLAPSVIKLMKMLFDFDTYRAAMMEFEINMAEMPLGKLSKHNIHKGFEALTEIQKLLGENNHVDSVKESLLIDASNRFFTLIPSIHPHVIREEHEFKSKVEMLEALQDMEIASTLVNFDDGNKESIDDIYKKLRCDITPLHHDSEDYQLIQRYLNTTHATAHKKWSLEVMEVFSLEREGELYKFAPYGEKLGNRMLLWHGSRLTNFVGILSQGLRVAPPESPSSGYMFGKGIYFADLASKSSKYCHTNKNNPVGLMLLSEVALGDVHELTHAEYMEKPPEGKHSTKGLGTNVPRETESVKWRDDVIVPCGKPVRSKIKASGLLHNEYIVYNTAQVKLRFLLKVRFHHKR